MLAPYPDRLRSSRSTPAPSNTNANSASTPTPTPTSTSTSTSTPTPPPPSSNVLSTTSASQHKLFSSRSSTRMRTNSLSSPSPSHADSPSSSTDHVSSRPFRNSSRRPAPNRRPSTSPAVPDQKHQPLIPIVVPSSAAIVSPLSTHHSSALVHYIPSVASLRLYTNS